MKIFSHYLYEFKKGVRELLLCTLPGDLENMVTSRLEKNDISYMIQKLDNGNMNVFFGKEECLVVVRLLCRSKALNQLSAEEDFILGTLLGYSVSEQCRRYTKKQDALSAVLK